MNYTSGPWEMVSKKKRKKYYEHGEKIIILGNGSCQFGLATVEGPSNFDKQEEMRANASLIAAAPELLEGLKMILDLSEKATPEARHGSFLGDIGRIAESLIYKAENKGK